MYGDQIKDILNKNPKAKTLVMTVSKENYGDVMQKLLGYDTDTTKDDDLRKIVKLEDGSYWIELHQDDWDKEKYKMQNCGSVDKENAMCSYRDSKGQPHMDAEVQIYPNRLLLQLRGKQNRCPDKKYWPAAKELVKKLKLKIDSLEFNATANKQDAKDNVEFQMYLIGK
jgi:hypothetical protein